MADPRNIHRDVRYWLAQVEQAEKAMRTWHDHANRTLRRYRDKRPVRGDDAVRYNMLWSIVETTRPALYSQTPVPVVDRRFKDRQPVVRVACEVSERALSYCASEEDFDHTIEQAIRDWQITGLGQCWVRYEPEQEGEEVVSERTVIDFVPWRDFVFYPARTWAEVPWAGRKIYMTRDQLIKRFGEDIGGRVPLDADDRRRRDALGDDEEPRTATACVYEIWDKTRGRVVFFSRGYVDGLLEDREPPFKLRDFWPFPRPLLANTTSDSIIPEPDYWFYKDQAVQIDETSYRIALLTKALKVAGVYAADATEVERLLSEATENRLIPVSNWAMFAEKGGLKGMTDWLPIEQVARTLLALYDARDRLKQDLYEITGFSDIIRGASNPSETATAQRIKTQWAGLRLRDRQREVQRFIRDLFRVQAEIIAEHFSPETLSQMTGLPEIREPDAATAADPAKMAALQERNARAVEQFQAAIRLLRDDAMRSFRIQVETDSTIMPDEDAEKQRRTEFLSAVTAYLQQAGVIAQTAPQLTPLLGEFLLFGVRGFRAGRQLEGAIEEAVDEVREQPRQPEQPDPAAVAQAQAAQVDAQIRQADLQLKAQDAQQRAAAEQAKMQLEAQRIAQEGQKLALEERRLQIEELKARADIVLRARDAGIPVTQTGLPADERQIAMEEDMRQVAESIQALAAAVAQTAQAQSAQMGALMERMDNLAAAMTAPKEIVRDKSGRPVGVKIAGVQ